MSQPTGCLSPHPRPQKAHSHERTSVGELPGLEVNYVSKVWADVARGKADATLRVRQTETAKEEAMSAPGADPLAAIRQRAEQAEQATSGRWYVEEVRPGHDDLARVYDERSMGVCKPTTDNPMRRRPVAEFIAHAREDIPFLLKHWDTRESALRALVAQWREEIGGDPLDRFDDGWVAAKGGCIEQLERLLSGPQP